MEPETWLEFCQRMRREHGEQAVDGAQGARTEIERYGWTRDTARYYLDNASKRYEGRLADYARGFDAAVRWFAEASCGRSPSPGGPR